MRVHDPSEHVEDRQSDGDGDPVEHVQAQDSQRGDKGQRQLARAETGEPTQLPDVDQPDRRIDDHRPQGRSGEQREHGAQEDRGPDHRHQGDQRVQLRPAAHGVTDGCAAAAAADRKAVEDPGGDVGQAQGQELLTAVDAGPAPRGECAGGDDAVRVGHHRDPERGRQQGGHVQGADVGQGRRGQCARHRSDDRHPHLVQAQHPHRRCAEEHRHQRSRAARPEPPADQQQSQRQRGEHHRRPAGLAQPLDDAPDLVQRRPALQRHARVVAQLTTTMRTAIPAM